jgi:PKD repeat protein
MTKTKIRLKCALIPIAMVALLGAFSGRALAGTNISKSPSWDSTCPRITTDPSGNIYAAWVEMYSTSGGDCFYSMSSDKGATWSTPFNFSNSGKAYVVGDRICDIAVDGSGRIYVIWAESEILKFRIYASGAWGVTSTLYTGTNKCNCPKVSVTPGGDIFTCWWTENGIVRSRARVGGNWEDVKNISRGGAFTKFPDIAVGNSVAYAVFVEKGSSGYTAGYTKRDLSYNSAWTAKESLPSHTGSNQHAVVAIDSSDVAHVVWTPELGGSRIMTYSHSTAGGFTPAEDISRQQMLHYPSIAAGGQRVCAIWQIGAYDAGTSVAYNIRQIGNWAGEVSIPQSGGGTFCDVASNPDGSVFYFLYNCSGDVYFSSNSSGPLPPPPPGNQPPISDFSFNPITGEYPLKVSFDGSASYDPDGSVVAYAWTFGDGGSGAGKLVDHTYQKNGTFTVKLTVTDDKGATGAYSRPIKILKPNVNPVADFAFSPTTGIFPLAVNFDASASHDPDGSVATYAWTFGDGATGNGKLTSHTYHKSGTFSIQLTVGDDRGGTGSKTKSITVLGLYGPLDIRWQTQVDESLFQSRYVTKVEWSSNPQNNGITQIVGYRIYRKATQDPITAYGPIKDVDSQTFSYLDMDVKGKDLYTYTVTALDNQGHESAILSTSGIYRDAERNIRLNRDTIK